MRPLDLLGTVLLLGLVAAGIAALLRALPWPAAWLKHKPWSCAACLGGHGAWMALLLVWATGELPLTLYNVPLYYFGATAAAAWVLHQLFPPAVTFD